MKKQVSLYLTDRFVINILNVKIIQVYTNKKINNFFFLARITYFMDFIFIFLKMFVVEINLNSLLY